jgi:heme/copper-type cytochrome/quinol oxidase subunit 2
LSNNLVCGHPESLKGRSFDKVPVLALPCNPKDNFNPYKMTYGLAPAESGEQQSTFLTVVAGIAVVCIVAITTSAVVFTVVYVRKHQNRYQSMHNVHYVVTPQGPGMTIENAIYRDNPTTIPAAASSY